jgi:hypothetical protein
VESLHPITGPFLEPIPEPKWKDLDAQGKNLPIILASSSMPTLTVNGYDIAFVERCATEADSLAKGAWVTPAA